MSDNEQPNEFEAVKNRLAEIAETVDDESLSLDAALDLYEEAVALGLQASDLLESGIVPPEEGAESGEAPGEMAGDPASAEQMADGATPGEAEQDSAVF